MERLNKKIKFDKNTVGADDPVRPFYEGLAKTHGITLVTLTITIIIMLILAGLIIDATIDDGIIDDAYNTTEQLNNRIAKDEEITAGIIGDIKDELKGGTTTPTTPPSTPVEGSITLNKSSLTLEIVDGVNSEETLTATKQNLTGTVSWTSSTPTVATVDSNGKVTTVGAGTTTITASCGGKTATCTVTVDQYVILTLTKGSGVLGFGLLREENGYIYYETYDTLNIKVKKGNKYNLSKQISDGGYWYFESSPWTKSIAQYEEERSLDDGYYGQDSWLPDRSLLPRPIARVEVISAVYYNKNTNSLIDTDNFYPNESMTILVTDND